MTETLSYWDNAALGDPYSAILAGHNEKSFWAFNSEEENIKELNKNMIFLDFGCGIGRTAMKVAPLVKQYYGADFSEEMIKKAKEIFKDFYNVHFFVNNGKDLKLFLDNEFDIVFTFLVFQHIEKLSIFNYFKEIHRVLKTEGIFIANHIPKIEKYYEGLTKEELMSNLDMFKILEFKETPFYYNLKCKK